jgi:hypothetical protein
MIIRHYVDQDWIQVWAIIEPVFRAGETYAFSPNITEQEARHVWIEIPEITFVNRTNPLWVPMSATAVTSSPKQLADRE